MFRRIRKPITTKQTMRIVYLLNKTKKFLAIIGMLGIIWSSGPMQYLNAMTSNVETYETILLDDLNQNKNDNIDYPLTTDEDFDPSLVDIQMEVISERTSNTKTFRKIDGTYEVAVYDTAVHYLENGVWKDINNSLQEFDSEYETVSNSFKLKFPKTLDDNKQIKMVFDDYKIDWSVLDIQSSAIEDLKDRTLTAEDEKDLLNINQSVLYSDIQNNIDLEYGL
jgi:hypothetical protein